MKVFLKSSPLLLLICFSGLSTAAEFKPENTSGNMMNMLLALMAVIGLIFACAWFVRRISGATGIASKHVKVISVIPLGTKEKLVLIETGGTQILLGVTSHSITRLHEYPESLTDSSIEQSVPFSEKLMAIVKGSGQWHTGNQESQDKEK